MKTIIKTTLTIITMTAMAMIISCSQAIADSGFYTGQAAAVVVGQTDMTGSDVNQGVGPSAIGLSFPYYSFIAQNKLIVIDDANNRVLIYNSIPTTNGAVADVVIGQSDMTSNSCNQGGSPTA